MYPTILVFVQTGCEACEEFMKRFKPIADPYYHSQQVAIQVGDIARNRAAASMADKYRIHYTPTVIGQKSGVTEFRLEGAVDDDTLKKAFEDITR